jgi:hypothetical protein
MGSRIDRAAVIALVALGIEPGIAPVTVRVRVTGRAAIAAIARALRIAPRAAAIVPRLRRAAVIAPRPPTAAATPRAVAVVAVLP